MNQKWEELGLLEDLLPYQQLLLSNLLDSQNLYNQANNKSDQVLYLVKEIFPNLLINKIANLVSDHDLNKRSKLVCKEENVSAIINSLNSDVIADLKQHTPRINTNNFDEGLNVAYEQICKDLETDHHPFWIIAGKQITQDYFGDISLENTIALVGHIDDGWNWYCDPTLPVNIGLTGCKINNGLIYSIHVPIISNDDGVFVSLSKKLVFKQAYRVIILNQDIY